MPYGRTDGLTLKDSATQLLKKIKSGALVAQFRMQKSTYPCVDESTCVDKEVVGGALWRDQ